MPRPSRARRPYPDAAKTIEDGLRLSEVGRRRRSTTGRRVVEHATSARGALSGGVVVPPSHRLSAQEAAVLRGGAFGGSGSLVSDVARLREAALDNSREIEELSRALEDGDDERLRMLVTANGPS